MHFEILVEDVSGKKMLEILIPKIIGDNNSFTIHAYKGIGHIPKNINRKTDPSKRILLNNLPKLLKGYGKTFKGYDKDFPTALIIICDLDDKCLKGFRNELFTILNSINPKPDTSFCIAIEEGEAWLLGDKNAIIKAFPTVKQEILNNYKYDSICGTWEVLADSLFKGGAAALSSKGWNEVGKMKSFWAEKIAMHMNVNNNESPSFNYFKNKITNKTS